MLFFVFRLQEIIIRFIVVIQAFGGNSQILFSLSSNRWVILSWRYFFSSYPSKRPMPVRVPTHTYPFSWLTVRHRTEEDKPFWILMICWKAYCFISVALKGRDNNRQIIKKTGFFFIRIVQGVAAKVVYCFGNTKYCAKYPV